MRIFYGKVKTENGGVSQLKENYLRGPVKWFGELEKGDFAIISEDNKIKNIRVVESIEVDGNEKVYKFSNILDEGFKPAKIPSDILYTKYFKFNKSSANLAYKQNSQNFNELTINDEYKDKGIEEFKFDKDSFNTIYFAIDINEIKKDNKDIEPRDYIIIVSDKKEGYKIKNIYEVSENKKLQDIKLQDINDTLNIDRFGLEKAYEIEKGKEFKKTNRKKNILATIIKDLDQKGYYAHPHNSGLANMYDTMIINPDEQPSKKQRETINSKFNKEVHVKEEIDEKTEIYNINSQNELTENICSFNQIFYGAPGCGKSFKVERILEKNEIDNKHNMRILFHPDYSYTDFVGQLQPVVEEDGKKITYEFKPGPFSKILKDALLDNENNYVLIIDEINRGNAPAIFGDVFQLLDRDEDGNSEYSIKNDLIEEYLKRDEGDGIVDIDNIIIPNNLYIFATMNTCDQNVFTLDTAFKRRWHFEKISNIFENSEERGEISIEGLKSIDGIKDITWREFQTTINNIITTNLFEYGIDGEDKQLGKYFVTKKDLADKTKFAHKVLMYLWDDVVRVDRGILFKAEYHSLDKLIKDFIDERIGMRVFNFYDKIKEGENLSE